MSYKTVSIKDKYIRTDGTDEKILTELKDLLFTKLWHNDTSTKYFTFPAFRTAYLPLLTSNHNHVEWPDTAKYQPTIDSVNFFNERPTFKFKPKILRGHTRSGAKTIKLALKHDYTLNQLLHMGYSFSEVRMSAQVETYLENTIARSIDEFNETCECSVLTDSDITSEIFRFRENLNLERPQKVYLPRETLINLILSSQDDLRPEIFKSLSELMSYIFSFDTTWSLLAKSDIGSNDVFTFVEKMAPELFHSNDRWQNLASDLFVDQNEKCIFAVPMNIKATAINQMLQDEKPKILNVLKDNTINLSKINVVFNWLNDFDLTNKNWITFIKLFLACGGHLKTTDGFKINDKIKILSNNLKLLDTDNQPVNDKNIMQPYEFHQLVKTFATIGKDVPPDLGENIAIKMYDNDYLDKDEIELYQNTGVTSFVTNVDNFALIDFKLAEYTFLKRFII